MSAAGGGTVPVLLDHGQPMVDQGISDAMGFSYIDTPQAYRNFSALKALFFR